MACIRKPLACSVAHGGGGRGAADRAGAATDVGAAGADRTVAGQSGRHGFAECNRCGHRIRVRLSGRRAGALRDGESWGELHPGVPRHAAGADDQRAGVAAILLGRAAADHGDLCLRAAADHGHRRTAGAGRRRACVRRYDRSAAAGQAVSCADVARRTVRADDLRHGRRCRYSHDNLRGVSGAGDSERAGQHPDCVDHQHAGSAGGSGADGSVRRA